MFASLLRQPGRSLLIVLLALAPQLSCRDGSQSEPPGRPNVVVIVADTLSADRMSVYGYERDTTPFLRELAADGTLFTAAYSQGLRTRTSIPSLLTSTYVSEHGNISNAPPIDQLPTCVPSLVETMRTHGYNTVGFAGPMLPGSFYVDYGWNRGFDHMEVDWYTEESARQAKSDPRAVRQIDINIVSAFRRWMAATEHDRPFFAYLHLMGAHGPFETAPRYASHFLNEEDAQLFRENFAHSYEWKRARAIEHPAELRYIRDSYDAAIRFTDENIQQIVEELRARDLLENTIVVIVSDHGENLLEHDIPTAWLHGYSNPPRQPLIHIPLVWFGPGVPGGLTVAEDVMQIDVAPTLLHLTGIEIPSHMRGLNLLDREALRRRSVAVSESQLPPYRVKSLVSGNLKYVRTFADLTAPLFARAHYTGETLFDLARDPSERSNAAFRSSGQLRRFRELLDKVVIRGQAGWHIRIEGDGNSAEYQVNLRVAEPLRRLALHYLNPEAPIDFAELRRASLLDPNASAFELSEEPLTFSARPGSSGLPPRSVVVFGAWARVTESDAELELSISSGSMDGPIASVAARGPQADWTPVWAYAAGRMDDLTLQARKLSGSGSIELRDPFLSIATESFDFETIAQSDEVTIPVRITDGAMDINFETRSPGAIVEIAISRDGQLLDSERVRVGAAGRQANGFRAAPENVFLATSRLQDWNFPAGTVSIYSSGCCPVTVSVTDEIVAEEAKKRLRALGYLK